MNVEPRTLEVRSVAAGLFTLIAKMHFDLNVHTQTSKAHNNTWKTFKTRFALHIPQCNTHLHFEHGSLH